MTLHLKTDCGRLVDRPIFITNDSLMLTVAGSRISPRRGCQLPGGGRQHTILPNFPKNCMKLKEFGPRGASHPYSSNSIESSSALPRHRHLFRKSGIKTSHTKDITAPSIITQRKGSKIQLIKPSIW